MPRARLSAALDLATGDGSRLTAKERRFLDASRQAQADELAAVGRRAVVFVNWSPYSPCW
ncbi:hypothetical protein ACFXOD_33235 [Streptomyces sp. NPDC059161]|uniref:hypothetical protein n=1 Tax=Streptomyces sp. NPDC059161 TaxID=3346749 RepID=UPI0036854D79